MLEVEVKYRLPDPGHLLAALAGWSAEPPRLEEDHYFNAPDRDFARTDEAIRVRSVGPTNVITYKGPKKDLETKTRLEMEVPLPDGPEAAASFRTLLTHLGYRASGIVKKNRRPFRDRRDGFEVQATIDELTGLGTFAELEIVTEEARFEAAKAVVLNLAKEFGLGSPERRSYLHLWLEHQRIAPAMQVVKRVDELRAAVARARRSGQTVGLVPTMGALHAGHAALISRAIANGDFVVASIFVNPTQFGPNEDFGKYPRTWEDDLALCRKLGVSLVFAPEAETVYPAGFQTFVDVGEVAQAWEGASRPGHFRGVATVVLKLFNMVQPQVAYFGQKDAQQVAVVRQLIRDLDLPVNLVIVPTVREPDGLALSSRNRYLSPSLRAQAAVLHQALLAAAARWAGGERRVSVLQESMVQTLAGAPDAVLNYAAVVDPATFAPTDRAPALAVIAARLGSTRLIDNQPLCDE